MTEPSSARDAFRAAYENRYTWDANFPGYSADLEIKQGSEVYAGQIRIDSDLSVEVIGIESEQVREKVRNWLRDVVTHRQRSAFEQTHQKNEFSFGAVDNSGAREILVQGSAMGSSYKVRDRVITYVYRHVGQVVFSIDTQETLDTGSGYVPTRYDVVVCNPETNAVISRQQHEDSYVKVGDYYIMAQQVTRARQQDQEATVEFNLSNIKLLAPAIAAL